MSITVEELQELAGHGKVVTDRGEKVGSIGEIYVDDVTGAPDWVTVRTGLFGTAETFVPLQAARVEGGDLVVPYSKDLIKDAPASRPTAPSALRKSRSSTATTASARTPAAPTRAPSSTGPPGVLTGPTRSRTRR